MKVAGEWGIDPTPTRQLWFYRSESSYKKQSTLSGADRRGLLLDEPLERLPVALIVQSGGAEGESVVVLLYNLRRETLRQKDRGEDDCTVPVVCRRGLFLLFCLRWSTFALIESTRVELSLATLLAFGLGDSRPRLGQNSLQ